MIEDGQYFSLVNQQYLKDTESERFSEDAEGTHRLWLWPITQTDSVRWLQCFQSAGVTHFKQTVSDEILRFELIGLDDESIKSFKEALIVLNVNFLLLPSHISLSIPKLMVFDMDSTLIQMECIDELARRCGFYEQVASITERAMQGELDFAESLRERVKCLKGLSLSVITELAAELPITKGVKSLAALAKNKGIRCAIVSGGFVPFVEPLRALLDFEFAEANSLKHVNEQLTGEVEGDIVDGEKKREFLENWRRDFGLKPEDVWAIGDGANDLPMMRSAGLGVAFHAKPAVKAEADAAIVDADMNGLIQLMMMLDKNK